MLDENKKKVGLPNKKVIGLFLCCDLPLILSPLLVQTPSLRKRGVNGELKTVHGNF